MTAWQMSLLAGILLATVASAVVVVWARQENRSLFVELTQLQEERDALNIEFGRLELERTTAADPVRIERVARDVLGMREPEQDEYWMIAP